MDLRNPITKAGQFFKRNAALLEKLGITTFYDLLYHLPFRYEDYSLVSKISQVQAGEIVTIQGTVKTIKNAYLRSGKKLQQAIVTDETGEIEAVWFNQPYLAKVMKQGDYVSLAGRISEFLRNPKLESPEYEIIQQGARPIHTGRLVPIYPETKGISSKWLRRQIHKLLHDYKDHMQEYLPYELLEKNNFYPLFQALQQVHFPDSLEQASLAKQRLAFEELFILQLTTAKRKQEWQTNLKTDALNISSFTKQIEKLKQGLPFTLTNAQEKALNDIFTDLEKNKPMNRLVEGDVGSGKTIVAAISMYITHLNGFQSVLMAPTEILAQQHYSTISNLLKSFGVKVGLATGSKKVGIRNKELGIKEKNHNSSFIIPNSSNFDILVGTHAVLSDKINFNKLGLVVIDEQQRFGVEQRGIIRKKGNNPHVLTMTATPIPRTIALTLYGDLDLSHLHELPKGRKLIKTWLVPSQKRDNAYKWIEEQIKKGDQAFIICPFIEESESMQTVKAANKEYERLQKNVFPNLKIGLLHGKIKPKEKDQVLQDFKDKKYNILIATPVVEVGIDIPNATIIMIEASERFGLSQLHQLRGRVGRGDKQSYCLLFTESTNPQTIERLKAMETLHIGSELAELDLKLRGSGDIYGTRQHGSRNLKIASFSDFALIEKAKKEAQSIFPKLSSYPDLLEKIEHETTKEISPD